MKPARPTVAAVLTRGTRPPALAAGSILALAVALALGCAPRPGTPAAASPGTVPAAAHEPAAADPCVRAPVPAETAARLGKVWVSARRAPIADSELPAAIDALFSHHLAAGFFADRFEGMQRLTGFGPDGDLEIQLSPRRKAPEGRSDKGADVCALCNPPFPEERGLAWRAYHVWPNAFPYVPAEAQHLLVTTAEHRAQGFDPELLGDILDFQQLAAGGRPLTMHYNGTAGNSQFHLHWQGTREVLPLERALDAGRLPASELLREDGGHVVAYEGKVFAGFLLEGDRSFVTRWAARLVRQLEVDPLTKGFYNFLVLGPRTGAFRVALIPRRAERLKPELGSLGPQGFGAFNFGGVYVLAEAKVAADVIAALPTALRESVVPPREFGWTAALRSLPVSLRPGLRVSPSRYRGAVARRIGNPLVLAPTGAMMVVP